MPPRGELAVTFGDGCKLSLAMGGSGSSPPEGKVYQGPL